jgi:phosphoribosyl 1,2-cyclic phosphodiesterase
MIKFFPIASGSSGNSVFIGTPAAKILIDAGASGKRIERALNSIGENAEKLDALFITHEHIDHVSCAGVISRRFDVPIYAVADAWDAMEAENRIGKINPRNKRIISPRRRYEINDIVVRPFEIPHDAANPVGYNVFAERFKLTTATDIGHVVEELKESLANSDVLLLEANHDIDMLKTGRYPYPLKKRILGDFGHLSNESCGNLLAEIFSPVLKYVYLGHLSAENNRPELAFNAVKQILLKKIKPGGMKMTIASRDGVSPCAVLGREVLGRGVAES